MECIKELAAVYPQLYLDPDRCGIEEYRSVVLAGAVPDIEDLSHFETDERDRIEKIATPAGEAAVVTLYKRQDFEVFIRCMMAAKDGPEKAVPATMGASTIACFNWPRIKAHREEFFRTQREAGVEDPDWGAEFARFREVKENYMDMLIVLSRGPYSNIAAGNVSPEMSDDEWLEKSDSIRKYHELTHFVCRKLYPDMIDAVWDELAADAAGLYAAYGCYDENCRRLEEIFLGISEGRYSGGRLENYIKEGEDIDQLASRAGSALKAFASELESFRPADIFGLMVHLEEMKEDLWGSEA